jgi:hypothetical protein
MSWTAVVGGLLPAEDPFDEDNKAAEDVGEPFTL